MLAERSYQLQSQIFFAKIGRAIAFGVIGLVGVFVVAVLTHPASKDYIAYWSAGRLVLHHASPYQTQSVLSLEQSQSYSGVKPLIMRNPPWALFWWCPSASSML